MYTFPCTRIAGQHGSDHRLSFTFFEFHRRFPEWFRRFADEAGRRLAKFNPIRQFAAGWRIDNPYISRPGGLNSPIRQFADVTQTPVKRKAAIANSEI